MHETNLQSSESELRGPPVLSHSLAITLPTACARPVPFRPQLAPRAPAVSQHRPGCPPVAAPVREFLAESRERRAEARGLCLVSMERVAGEGPSMLLGLRGSLGDHVACPSPVLRQVMARGTVPAQTLVSSSRKCCSGRGGRGLTAVTRAH